MIFSNVSPEQGNPQFTLQLQQELQFAKFLVNNIADAVFWLGSDARFLYVNNVACRSLGYSREELLSLTIHDVFSDFSAEVWAEQWRSLKQQGSLTFASRHLTKKGCIFPVEITFTYMEYQGREFSCAFARNQTAELKVRATLKQAKKLSKLRARFVCMLCHELRTPLNIISLSTSLLKRHSHQWTEETKLPHFVRIQTAVEQLSQLLDEVLLIGKSEAGKLKFEPKPLDLAPFCCDLVAQIQLMSNSSQHVVTFVSRGNCTTAHIDKKLLQPLLTNLLLNGIKYSPPGSTVALELSCRDENVIFQIKDAGIGIPAADQQQMFEPFHRGSNVGDVPGSGLGLAVVKKLVDLHCGQIAVVSEVEVGTTFIVMLPLVGKYCK